MHSIKNMCYKTKRIPQKQFGVFFQKRFIVRNFLFCFSKGFLMNPNFTYFLIGTLGSKRGIVIIFHSYSFIFQLFVFQLKTQCQPFITLRSFILNALKKFYSTIFQKKIFFPSIYGKKLLRYKDIIYYFKCILLSIILVELSFKNILPFSLLSDVHSFQIYTQSTIATLLFYF